MRAAYGLPTERRGILAVGPLAVEVSDPFGLASVSTAAAPVAELTVWPAIDEVVPIPHTQGDDPHGGADHPNALTTGGDDFYALRPYVGGRRPAPGPLALDRPPRPVDGPPGRAALAGPGHRAARHPARRPPPRHLRAGRVGLRQRRGGHRPGAASCSGWSPPPGSTRASPPARRTSRRSSSTSPWSGRSTATSWSQVLGTLRRGGSAGAFAAFLGGRAKADFEAVAGLSPAYGRVVTVAFATGRDRPPGPGRQRPDPRGRHRRLRPGLGRHDPPAPRRPGGGPLVSRRPNFVAWATWDVAHATKFAGGRP